MSVQDESCVRIDDVLPSPGRIRGIVHLCDLVFTGDGAGFTASSLGTPATMGNRECGCDRQGRLVDARLPAGDNLGWVRGPFRHRFAIFLAAGVPRVDIDAFSYPQAGTT